MSFSKRRYWANSVPVKLRIPWPKWLPRPVWLIIAAFLVLLPHFFGFEWSKVLAPIWTAVKDKLSDFTAYLNQSLTGFDALNVSSVFYQELMNCRLCPEDTGLFERIFAAIINTTPRVVGQTTSLGVLIYLLSVIIAAVWLAELQHGCAGQARA